jgi:D-threo-aldose 1-dehydrogenase
MIPAMLAAAPKTLNSRTARPVPLTAMGFGGAPLGNMYRAISEAEAQAVLQAAYEAGIGFYDTAPLYGLGRSEERFGAALARWGVPQPTLSTKIGRLLEDCAPGPPSTLRSR